MNRAIVAALQNTQKKSTGLAIFHLLCPQGALQHSKIHEIVQAAVSAGHTEFVRDLVRQGYIFGCGSRLRNSGGCLLSAFAQGGDVELLQFAIEYDIDRPTKHSRKKQMVALREALWKAKVNNLLGIFKLIWQKKLVDAIDIERATAGIDGALQFLLNEGLAGKKPSTKGKQKQRILSEVSLGIAMEELRVTNVMILFSQGIRRTSSMQIHSDQYFARRGAFEDMQNLLHRYSQPQLRIRWWR